MPLNTIEELVEEMRQGRMVILMDDEDRENEGDLIMAAEKVRPEDINFMARYGRGLICLTLTRERCERLRLPLMVSSNDAKFTTNFTVSIEAAEGVTTGISAADRAVTVQAAVAADAQAEDVVQPGHIFPLMAQPGGVLTRAGHTEAGCDLARLAGCEPASVIVEILNEDGTMARRPDLERFAAEHGIKIGTIADLIHYRLQHEKSVERVAESNLATAHGDFRLCAYRDLAEDHLHLALIHGDPAALGATAPLVRVHVENSLCDLPGVASEACGWPLADAMRRIAAEPSGVVIVLRGQRDDSDLVRQIHDWQLRDRGISQPQPAGEGDLRTYGIGAQILADLGIHRMRVLGTPRRMHGLSGFDLEVVEYIHDGHPCYNPADSQEGVTP